MKTRQGGLVKQQCRLKQNVFATGNSQCPVKFQAPSTTQD